MNMASTERKRSARHQDRHQDTKTIKPMRKKLTRCLNKNNILKGQGWKKEKQKRAKQKLIPKEKLNKNNLMSKKKFEIEIHH